MTETIPWYKAAIAQRLALSIIVHIIGLTPLAKYIVGLDLAPLVDDLLEGLGLALDALAFHARATKPVPPIALNQARADSVNLLARTVPAVPLSKPPEDIT